MSESTTISLLAKAEATVTTHPVFRAFDADAKRKVAVTMAYHELAASKNVNPECWSTPEIGEFVYGLALGFDEATDPGAEKLTAAYMEFHFGEMASGPDSIDRESAFNLFTVVTGLSYGHFFDAWMAYGETVSL